ncbi:MAG: DUF6585 family protein [Chloroflexota bacterium]
MQATQSFSEMTVGNKRILPAITYTIFSIGAGVLAWGMFQLLQGQTVTEAIVAVGFMLFLFGGYSLYLLLYAIRLFRLQIQVNKKGLQVVGFRKRYVKWKNVKSVRRVITQQRHEGITFSTDAFEVKTLKDEKLIINSVFQNYGQIVQDILTYSTEPVALNLLKAFKRGETIKYQMGTFQMNKEGITMGGLISKSHYKWRDMVYINDKSTHFEIVRQSGKPVCIFYNLTNAVAIRRVVLYFIQRNQAR